MINDRDRRLLQALMFCRVVRAKYSIFRTVDFHAVFGFRWILKSMRRRQVVDDLKHAPCCQANHWHRARIVFQRCNCGAAAHHRDAA